MDQNKKLLIVMRHGERSDDPDLSGKVEMKLNEDDPELTINGINQARSIGAQLKLLIKTENIEPKNISLYSSPFSRTLMTTLGVIEGLSQEEANYSFKIMNGAYEYLNHEKFKAHPENILEYHKLYSDNITHSDAHTIFGNLLKFNPSVDKADIPSYPEDFQDCLKRYRNTLSRIKEEFMKNDSDVAIVVTHGYGVQTMAEYLNITADWFIVEYCSSYVFSIGENGYSKYLCELSPKP
jgi:broad specificity phosphatase PhoE